MAKRRDCQCWNIRQVTQDGVRGYLTWYSLCLYLDLPPLAPLQLLLYSLDNNQPSKYHHVSTCLPVQVSCDTKGGCLLSCSQSTSWPPNCEISRRSRIAFRPQANCSQVEESAPRGSSSCSLTRHSVLCHLLCPVLVLGTGTEVKGVCSIRPSSRSRSPRGHIAAVWTGTVCRFPL